MKQKCFSTDLHLIGSMAGKKTFCSARILLAAFSVSWSFKHKAGSGLVRSSCSTPALNIFHFLSSLVKTNLKSFYKSSVNPMFSFCPHVDGPVFTLGWRFGLLNSTTCHLSSLSFTVPGSDWTLCYIGSYGWKTMASILETNTHKAPTLYLFIFIIYS